VSIDEESYSMADEGATAPEEPNQPATSAELQRRLREEVARAARNGTALATLAIVIENLDDVVHDGDGSLRDRTTAYLADTLASELRAYDRVGQWPGGALVVILPGADAIEAERVARRLLARIRSVKLEIGGERHPLTVTIGFANFAAEATGDDLLLRALSAARHAGAERIQLAAVESPNVF
jgi:diguanylate cyclase (GGDEF)-like protein